MYLKDLCSIKDVIMYLPTSSLFLIFIFIPTHLDVRLEALMLKKVAFDSLATALA